VILPFSFPRDDRESRLLAEGLNEEFYSRLIGVQDLDVVSPVKMEPHAGNLIDGPAIRSLLGADYYLRGSVHRTTGKIRIYFTLHMTTDDCVVWSDKFDSPSAIFLILSMR